MKFLRGILVSVLLAWAAPALAQNPATVKLCVPTSATQCAAVSATNPLPITGSFSATLAGFTPNGNYTTLTATASTSASTTLPAGTVVAFQNLSSIDVSCVLTAGASTATTNKLIVRAGATVYYTVGSNTTTACINQTGSASNVVGLAGGAGLGTAFGGASSGGGGGGAVTLASGAVASGAYSAGSIAAGAYVSGSILSGALASGAVVDLTNLSTPVAPNTATATKGILLGGQYDSTQKTLTNGQQGAVSLSPRGAVYVAAGAEALVVGGAGTAGSASGGVLTVQGSASGTAIPVSGTVTATPTGTQAVSIASAQVASGAIASGAVASGAVASGAVASGALAVGAGTDGWDVTNGAKADSACGTATGTCSVVALLKYLNTAAGLPLPTQASTVSIGGVGLFSGGSIMSATNGIYSNILQGNAVISTTNGLYSNLLQGNAVISATNGIYANQLQGNAVLSATNPSFSRPTDGTSARVFDPCEVVAHVTTPISISSAATSVIVAGTSSKKTYICGMMLFSAGTTNVGIVQGSGSTCGTSTLGLIGGATSATGPNLTAQAGFVGGNGNFAIAGTTVNANDICLINSQAIQVSGYIVTATP